MLNHKFILLTVGLMGVNAFAKEKIFTRVFFRDGNQGVFEFVKYEDKRFQLEFKKDGQKVAWRLAKIAAISLDTTISEIDRPLPPTERDQIRLRNGSRISAIMSKLNREKLQMGLEAMGDKRVIPVDSISYVSFDPKVLNIERHDFATGFDLLDSASVQDMADLSAQEIEQQSPMLNDPTVDGYLDSLTKSIGRFSKRAGASYACKAINSDEVNAFTIGGGRIFIYRGLLERLESEDELAGVIAHEIGHNIGNHISQRLSKQLLYAGLIEASGVILNQNHNQWVSSLKEAGGVVAFFGLQKYSRDDEREADLLGFYNLYQAGINPRGMVTLFDTFKKLGGSGGNILEQWAATHPDPEERQENVAAELSEIDADGLAETTDRFEWIREYVTALPPPVLSIDVWTDSMTIPSSKLMSRILDLTGPKIKAPVLRGRFVAIGGTHNDIKFRIMDEVNYINWMNGNKASDLFNTDKVTVYDVDFKFPRPGKYYLVFDNTNALLTDKTVITSLQLKYTER